MGFKTAGFPKFGFNPIGFKQSIGGFASLVKSAGGELYLDARKADGSGPLTGNEQPFSDLAKAETDGRLEGNSSAYVEFSDFTDANLPTKFEIEFDGVFNDSNASSGLFGFDSGGSDEFWLGTLSSGVNLRLEIWGGGSSSTTTLSLGQDINVLITVDTVADTVEWTINTVSQPSFSITKTLSNEPLQLLTRGLVSNPSSHKIKSFKITDTDTGTIVKNIDYTNQNVGVLTNFAGTGTSGWQATPSVLRFDGVDDFVAFADTASLDITNAPLAIGVTLKVANDQQKFVCTKNNVAFGDVQYGILLNTGRFIQFYKNGGVFASFNVDSANYVNVVFHWDGVNITAYENGIQKVQNALGGTLISSGTFKLGMANNPTPSLLLDADICTQTIYTGSDINKILKAEAKISAEYLALNP